MGCFWQGLSALPKTSWGVSALLQHQGLLLWPRCLLSIWRTDVCWAVPNCSWLQTDLKKSFSSCKAMVKNRNRTSCAKTTKFSIHWIKGFQQWIVVLQALNWGDRAAQLHLQIPFQPSATGVHPFFLWLTWWAPELLLFGITQNTKQWGLNLWNAQFCEISICKRHWQWHVVTPSFV